MTERPTLGAAASRLTLGILDDATDLVVKVCVWFPKALRRLPRAVWRRRWWLIAGPTRATLTMIAVVSFTTATVGAAMLLVWPVVLLGYLGKHRRSKRLA